MGRMPPLDEEPTSALLSAQSEGEPRIVVVWEGDTVTRPFPPGASLVIGRSKECDVVVRHVTVSRRHARITAPTSAGSPMVLEDLGSATGIRVDGEAMASGPCNVWPGQTIEIGDAIVLVHSTATSRPTTPSPVALDRYVSLMSKSDLPILIQGETGVGKEVMAERIHRSSPRKDRPFVALNCASLPESLLESELFGHERGAFTGAATAKQGLVETASGGTLLLDEVGELPPGAQATLLRVLETKEVRRVGSVKPFSVDIRILSATNQDLEARVREGTFRRDLLYRLNGATIRIPPLRERRDEIVPLAKRLLMAAAEKTKTPLPSLTAQAQNALVSHVWPGNVRELRHVMERALVLADGKSIDAEHLLLGNAGEPQPTLAAELDSLERAKIVQALASVDGNQTKAAALLGMSRRALINRLESFGLPRPRKNIG